jgi:hypothetical protein
MDQKEFEEIMNGQGGGMGIGTGKVMNAEWETGITAA